MKEKLVIIGTGSLSEEVVDFVIGYDLYEIVGFSVNREYIKSEEHLGYPVYPLEELDSYIDKEQVKLFISISWYLYMNKYKRAKYEELKKEGYHFANLISPTATIQSKQIGEGNWIGDFVYLHYNTEIGNNNTFLPHSFVGHYTKLGDHNVMSAKAIISGSCTVGNQNYFGVASVVFNKLTIGEKCIVGGGAVARRDVPDFTMAVAADSYYKQCEENAIEQYISVDHIKQKREKAAKGLKD